MIIKNCEGFDLEKTSKQSPEDAFARSVVTFESDGREKTFHLLYLKYFADSTSEFTPFKTEPLFTSGNRAIHLRDIAALVFIIKNPDFQQRKRVYINDLNRFAEYFAGIAFNKLEELFEKLETTGSYEYKSSIRFLKQPSEID